MVYINNLLQCTTRPIIWIALQMIMTVVFTGDHGPGDRVVMTLQPTVVYDKAEVTVLMRFGQILTSVSEDVTFSYKKLLKIKETFLPLHGQQNVLMKPDF